MYFFYAWKQILKKDNNSTSIIKKGIFDNIY